MSKRICFVCDSFISDKSATITGPMVQTYLIGKALSSRDWDVHYLAYSREGKDGQAETYEGMTIHWIRYRQFFPIFHYKKIRESLAAINADYHYQRGRDLLTGFTARYCRKNGKKFVWASAGESGIEKGKYVRQMRKKKRSFLKKCVLLCEALINDMICEYGIEHASRIIVQTEYQQGRLSDVFGLKSVVIRSGHPVPETVQRAMPLKILWIGSIKTIKRPELFIELANLCRDLECEFWIAGQYVDSRLKSFLLQKMQNMNNLKYLGAVPFHESQTLISKAHVLVNTTDAGYEGLPNAFVQAWVAGTVTLSLHSDPDGVIEKHGMGAKTETLLGMKNELGKMIRDPDRWKTMSGNARQFGTENFSIEKITDQIKTLITSL